MPDKLPAIPGILEEMTIDQVRHLNPEVVVLPIGSTEPHGPHLPYGTDTYQIDAMCRQAVAEANANNARALMYPTLSISNNVNFKAFPFACRIGVRTLMKVMLDIIEALEADGIRKIVLANGHGGNPDTLQATIREHVSRRAPGEGAFVCMVQLGSFITEQTWQHIENPSEHAGETETSMMLHLRPELVNTDKLGNFPMQEPVIDQLASGHVFYVRPWHGYLPASAGGETRTSSAEKGKLLIDEAANGLAGFLADLSAAQSHELFPFSPVKISV